MSNIQDVRTEMIELGRLVIPDDARLHGEAALATLAESLRRDGQLQDVVVTPLDDGRFEVLAGVGRVMAARRLEWASIRCLVRVVSSAFEKAKITFIENQDREDVSPIYQARLLAKMLGDRQMNQSMLAAEIGRSQDWVSDHMALLSFSPEAQEGLMKFPVPLSYLRTIKRLPTPEAQIKAAERCIKEDLTRKELRAIVRGPKEEKVVWPADPIAWVSGQVAIQRRFDPNNETVEHYVKWVAEALPKFLAEKPQQTTRRGRPAKVVAEQAAA
jgi:ParB/RepB/Spo0J family partition protein